MQGVILYGPPASGKDTVSEELNRIDGRYVIFERLKAGEGRKRGYRMTTESAIAELRDSGEVLWENRRYGAIYVVDRRSLLENLKTAIPILHLGQVEAVDAILKATPDVAWTVVYLWCPREVTAQRAAARDSTDIGARLAAWDETEPLLHADLTLNTDQVAPDKVAQEIARRINSRPDASRTA